MAYLPNMIMDNGTPTNIINKYKTGINLFFTARSAIHSAHFNGMMRKKGRPYTIAMPKILKNK